MKEHKKKEVAELSRRINEMRAEGAKLGDINRLRRKLNILLNER